MLRMKANTRREVTMRKDSKKVVTRRREVQKRDISMKITRVIRTSMDMNLITHIMRNMAKRAARREDQSMVSNQATVMAVMTRKTAVTKFNEKSNFKFH